MNIRSIIAQQKIVKRFVIGVILMDAMYKSFSTTQGNYISYHFVVDVIIETIISMLTKTF